jgi:hypothetical protein
MWWEWKGMLFLNSIEAAEAVFEWKSFVTQSVHGQIVIHD